MLSQLPVVRLDMPGCMAVTTMRGEGPDAYGGFNVCHYVGDAEAHVSAGRNLLARYFGVEVDKLLIPRQTHSSVVRIVDSRMTAADLDGVDGLVTGDDSVVLCVNTADCVPLVMCDESARVIAAVHSGWRGTVAEISADAVRAMCSIEAVMGPCICAGCFEVGPEVTERFKEVFPDVPGIVVRHAGQRDHINLGLAVRTTLERAGVCDDNVSLPVACSHCAGSPYFSARTLGVHSGRTVTAVMLSSASKSAPLG